MTSERPVRVRTMKLKTSLQRFLSPKSPDEDVRRGEFILNVLLLSTLALFAAAIMISVFASLYRPASHAQSSLPLLFLGGTLLFLCFLYFLSRRGFYQLSAHLFILLFFALSVFMGLKWGVDVNASILLYALSVVMAGVLLGARSAFLLTILIAASMTISGYLEMSGVIHINDYWRTEPWSESDTLMTAVVFLSVAAVSWLFGREMEKSLARARLSESLLKEERDALEITVTERTRELREAQTEKISQLYRFAEFGRLSSGLFHDLLNPLSAVSLNVEKGDLERALSAAKKMEHFILAVRRQMAKKKESGIFSLRESTEQVLDILSYKAQKAHARISLSAPEDLRIAGEEIKWNQVAMNLITNAIDAREETGGKITIRLESREDKIVFSVADDGSGIPAGKNHVQERGFAADEVEHLFQVHQFQMDRVVDLVKHNQVVIP